MTTPKNILFVRSGGGAPGAAIHAGMWMALDEAGIVPTAFRETLERALVQGIVQGGQESKLSQNTKGTK